MSFLAFLAIGLVAGLIARAIAPGRQSMGWLGTLALGVVGSFIGGMLGSFIQNDGDFMVIRPAGLIWSTVGALVVLAVAGLVNRRLPH